MNDCARIESHDTCKRWYSGGEGVDRKSYASKIWGGTVWDALHYITLGYPVRDAPPAVRQSAADYIFALQHLLPCSMCRQHFTELLRTEMPLTAAVLRDRASFGAYIIEARRRVNHQHVCKGGKECAPDMRHYSMLDVETRLIDDKRAGSGSSNVFGLLGAPLVVGVAVLLAVL